MRPDLLMELSSKIDPSWVLRAGQVFSEHADQWSLLRNAPDYANLREAAQEQAPQVLSVAPLQLREQVEQILMSSGAPAGLQWLYESGALRTFLPELHATVDFSQEAGRRHKDVWEHTKQVVWQASARSSVRWAAMLHDIGKVRTRTFTASGKVHFHRHSEVGAKMFDDIGKRLLFDRETHRTLRFLILNHLRPNQYVESWTDSAVRRFTKEMGGYLPELLELSRADITSRRPGKRQNGLQNLDALAARIDTIRSADAVTPPLPGGIGDVIMAHFHLPPSRLIGDLKRTLEESISSGELEGHMAASYYLPHVEKLLAERQSEPCICQE